MGRGWTTKPSICSDFFFSLTQSLEFYWTDVGLIRQLLKPWRIGAYFYYWGGKEISEIFSLSTMLSDALLNFRVFLYGSRLQYAVIIFVVFWNTDSGAVQCHSLFIFLIEDYCLCSACCLKLFRCQCLFLSYKFSWVLFALWWGTAAGY